MKIVITSNVVDGLEFWGPFEDGNEAVEWAEENFPHEWSLADVVSPADFETMGV